LLTPDEITRTLDLLAELDHELRFTSQPRLLVELAAVRVCRRPAFARTMPAPTRSREPGAASAPEPEAAQTPPEPTAVAEGSGGAEERAPLSLAEIKRRWEDLLNDLRKGRKVSLGARLVDAVPVAFEGDTLTLSFAKKHEFHYTELSKDEKHLKAVSDALARVFGREIAIKCQLESDEGRTRPTSHPKRVQEALTAFPGSEVEE